MIREVDLVSYLPEFMQSYIEPVAALEGENPEFDIMWKAVERVLYNHFITTADEYGINRFEKLMKIDSYGSLEERRFRCKAKWNEHGNYVFKWLQQQLDYLCGADGYNTTFIPDWYLLVVQVALKSKNNVTTIKDKLNRVMPVNMVWHVSLLYNQYRTLKDYSHKYLSGFTYAQLRNEVLNNE